MFFPLALCVTGRAEQENQQVFPDPLRQAFLYSLYNINGFLHRALCWQHSLVIARCPTGWGRGCWGGHEVQSRLRKSGEDGFVVRGPRIWAAAADICTRCPNPKQRLSTCIRNYDKKVEKLDMGGRSVGCSSGDRSRLLITHTVLKMHLISSHDKRQRRTPSERSRS